MVQSPSMEPTSTDWAWFGGIIDGEGTISASWDKPKKYKGDSRYMYVHISVTNTDSVIVQRCRDIAGTGTISQHINKNARQKDWSRWMIKGHSAIAVAKAIRPYVFSKKEHIALLLEWAGMPRFVGYHAKGTIAVTEDAMRGRADMVNRFRELNKRGR